MVGFLSGLVGQHHRRADPRPHRRRGRGNRSPFRRPGTSSSTRAGIDWRFGPRRRRRVRHHRRARAAPASPPSAPSWRLGRPDGRRHPDRRRRRPGRGPGRHPPRDPAAGVARAVRRSRWPLLAGALAVTRDRARARRRRRRVRPGPAAAPARTAPAPCPSTARNVAEGRNRQNGAGLLLHRRHLRRRRGLGHRQSDRSTSPPFTFAGVLKKVTVQAK